MCVAKRLISCPALSPCLPFFPLTSLPFLALSGSFPVPPTCNPSPWSCKKLQPSGRKLPQLPRVPHTWQQEGLAWLRCPMYPLLLSQCSRPSFPTPISPAFASGQELAETRVASHLCKRVSPWPPTTWDCSSGRAIPPLTRSLPAAGIWMLYRSHLSHLSAAQHILPAQNVSHPKTDQVLRSTSLGFRKVVRWFLGPVSENNLYMKTQH